MKICSKCGKQLNDGVNVCDVCGTPVMPQVTPTQVQQPTQSIYQPLQPTQPMYQVQQPMQQPMQSQAMNNQNLTAQIQSIYRKSVEQNRIMKLIAAIGQILVGLTLFYYGSVTEGWDWGYISTASAVGFLLTGVCGLIDIIKKVK